MANSNQTSETLLHFSHQLHSWCSERLAQKPGPFRQAELCRNILGDQELLSPPIVLWVNRESFLPGGLLVLPRYSEEDIFVAGQNLARIYGLPSFFSWGRHEISCWSTTYNPPEKIWEYELPDEDISSPATFRKSLNLLIDRMEGSFFESQQQIPEVSLPYLLNFVHTSMTDLLPDLKQELQIERSSFTGEDQPNEVARNLLLLQILLPIILTACDIPIQATSDRSIPDELARTADQLPTPLRTAFEKISTLPDFPKSCHRRLTHFVSRVQQLKAHFSGNTARLLEQLLAEWASTLGGHPLPGKVATPGQVIINPDTDPSGKHPEYEIAPPGILAATAAIRYFSNPDHDAGPKQLTSPLELTGRLSRHHLVGTLNEQRVPSSAEHKKLNTLLRVSWPNQKLALATKTPIWVWQFLHLCGLSEGNSRIELIIPKNWLWERYGEMIPRILLDHCTFSEISSSGPDQLHCKLSANRGETTVTIQRPDGPTRELKEVFPEFFRSQVQLALVVPEETYKLLDTGDLQFHEQEQCADLPPEGLSNYLNSSLGRDLWRLLATGRPLPRKDKIAEECARSGIPLPNAKVLSALGKLSGKDTPPSGTDLDHELAVWLGATSPLDLEIRLKRKEQTIEASEDQAEQFVRNCAAEEVPTFPDDYIYHVPSANHLEYDFVGRLEVIDSFFDQVVLRDQQQKELSVQGTKLAEALVLFSTAASGPLTLPASQMETANILDRYIQDLKKLRQAYFRHAVIYLPEDQTGKMVDKFWQNASLPDWELVRDR